MRVGVGDEDIIRRKSCLRHEGAGRPGGCAVQNKSCRGHMTMTPSHLDQVPRSRRQCRIYPFLVGAVAAALRALRCPIFTRPRGSHPSLVLMMQVCRSDLPWQSLTNNTTTHLASPIITNPITLNASYSYVVLQQGITHLPVAVRLPAAPLPARLMVKAAKVG